MSLACQCSAFIPLDALSRSTRWIGVLYFSLLARASCAIVLNVWGGSQHEMFRRAAILILFAVTSLQFFLIGRVLLDPKDTQDFYTGLQENRARRSDLVESYRHMREHGNSVSIVLCELLLAFVLWVLRPTDNGDTIALSRVGGIIGIWLLPSSLVWLIGSTLERHVSGSQSKRR
jgi:hypothetical protein